MIPYEYLVTKMVAQNIFDCSTFADRTHPGEATYVANVSPGAALCLGTM